MLPLRRIHWHPADARRRADDSGGERLWSAASTGCIDGRDGGTLPRAGGLISRSEVTTPSKARSSNARNWMLFGIKIGVAALLIGWLIRSGSLDMGALRILVQKPWLLAMNLGVFVAAALCATLRWRALLTLANVRQPFLRLLSLQLTATFFNVVIPGNVGGDVVKALYVARDADPRSRTTILLIVFIERLLGLGGLVTTAFLVTLLRGPTLWNDPLLRPMASMVTLVALATVIGPMIFLAVIRRAGDRIEAYTSGTTKLAKLLNQLVAAFRLLAAGPRRLVEALVISMVLHALAMGYFTVLTRVLGGYDVGYFAIATIFPLGLLTMVIPIAPAGLGVGHVAFDRLFAAIGLSGGAASGATIFNVYLLGQILPALVGVIPYIALRRRGALPDAAEAAVTES